MSDKNLEFDNDLAEIWPLEGGLNSRKISAAKGKSTTQKLLANGLKTVAAVAVAFTATIAVASSYVMCSATSIHSDTAEINVHVYNQQEEQVSYVLSEVRQESEVPVQTGVLDGEEDTLQFQSLKEDQQYRLTFYATGENGEQKKVGEFNFTTRPLTSDQSPDTPTDDPPPNTDITPDPKPDPQPDPNPEPKPDPKPETEVKPTPVPKPEPDPQPDPQPDPEPDPEPVYDPITYTLLPGLKVVSSDSETYTLSEGQFSFSLMQGNTTIETVTNDANGDFAFGDITVSSPGEHTYTVRENAGSIPGMTYDNTVYTITLSVADVDGALVIEESSITDGTGGRVEFLRFENIFEVQPIVYTLEGTTVLNGRDLNAGEFSFDLFDTSSETESTLLQTVTHDETGAFAFELTFSQVGTYTYQILEMIPEMVDPNIDYDYRSYNVTVEVTEENGILNASASIFNDDYIPEEQILFENSYYEPAVVTFNIQKVLTGRELVAGEFSFQLSAYGDIAATATNDAAGNVVFQVEVPWGTYASYSVKEVIGNDPNIIYDEREHQVTIYNISEEGPEVYFYEAGSPASTDSLTFYNTYAEMAHLTLSGTKILEGRELDPEEFVFTLTEVGSNMPTTYTAYNTADGTFSFDMRFMTVGTFRYILQEQDNMLAGIEYDPISYEVVVDVTVAEDGTLSASATVLDASGAPAEIVFKNTYTEPTYLFSIPNAPENCTVYIPDGDTQATELRFAEGELVTFCVEPPATPAEVFYDTNSICYSVADDIIIQHDMGETSAGPFYFSFRMPARDVGPNDILLNAPVEFAS